MNPSSSSSTPSSGSGAASSRHGQNAQAFYRSIFNNPPSTDYSVRPPATSCTPPLHAGMDGVSSAPSSNSSFSSMNHMFLPMAPYGQLVENHLAQVQLLQRAIQNAVLSRAVDSSCRHMNYGLDPIDGQHTNGSNTNNSNTCGISTPQVPFLSVSPQLQFPSSDHSRMPLQFSFPSAGLVDLVSSSGTPSYDTSFHSAKMRPTSTPRNANATANASANANVNVNAIAEQLLAFGSSDQMVNPFCSCHSFSIETSDVQNSDATTQHFGQNNLRASEQEPEPRHPSVVGLQYQNSGGGSGGDGFPLAAVSPLILPSNLGGSSSVSLPLSSSSLSSQMLPFITSAHLNNTPDSSSRLRMYGRG
eukprot:ANDGO_07365.mRNA.1 hypothetical protein